jgi:DNA-binding response OmpR family regulator
MTAPATRERIALIVDDKEESRILLERALRGYGYGTLSVADGAAALAVLASEPVDIVLLDWMMPGVSGLATLLAIRDRHPRSRLPVIMCTAVGEEEHVMKAIKSGANDYVVKPISPAVLRARMATHLSQTDEVLTLEQRRHDVQRRMADQIRTLLVMRESH